MLDTIKLIVTIYEKATIIVYNQTLPAQGKWRIKYDSNVFSDWKSNNTMISLDSGLYEIEFNEIDGYIKPDNYQCFLKPGEIKHINVIYTQNKSSILNITFLLQPEFQKYLSWKLIRPTDIVVVDWNHETTFYESLPQGNYQLLIAEYTSSVIPQNTQVYDYITGDVVSNTSFYISSQTLDIQLTQDRIISIDYNNQTYACVCVSINPEEIKPFVKWKLKPENTNLLESIWFDSGKTVWVPFGTYNIQTTTVSGWYIKQNSQDITISSNKEIYLVGIKGEINGNLRIKLSGEKNKARWRPINTTVWYMDNDEISLTPDSYEIEFLDVENYLTPENQFFNVIEDVVNIYTVVYIPLGSLQINIASNDLLESIDEPLWRIKGTTTWKRSTEIIYLLEDEYIIEFNNIGEIFTYEDIIVSVTNENTTIEAIDFVGMNILAVPTKSNINFYNFNNLQKLTSLSDLQLLTDVNQVVFNHNSTLIAIAHNETPYLTIFNFIDYTLLYDYLFVPPLSGCRSLDFSKDGKYLAVSHNSFPYLTVYNISDWTTISISTLPTNYCNTVKFSSDSSYLSIGFDQDPYLIVYDTTTFLPITISSNSNEVFSCKFDSNNRFLAVGEYNNFTIYDILDGFNKIEDIELNSIHGTIYGVDFIDNYLIIISSLYFYIYHYNNNTGTYIIDTKIQTPIPNINNYVEISPNNDYLLIGCTNDPYVEIYETTYWTRVEFTDSLLTYCKKFSISDDLSLREYVNTPINLYPLNDHRGLREFENLKGSEFTCFSLTYNISGSDVGLDNHIKSQWRLLNVDGEIVYDSDVSDDLIEHLLPSSFFDVSTTYQWQVRYQGENFGWSFWSEPTTFITMYSFVETPINSSPVDASVDIEEQPTLTASIFTLVNASDIHIYSEWKIFEIIESVNTQRYTSGAITNLTTHIVPKGILIGTTSEKTPEYAWQVRYKAESLGWSDWSTLTTFITAEWDILKPSNISPYDTEIDINEDNLTLISSEFETLNTDDTHTHSRYEIYDSNDILIHTSGEIPDTRINTDVEFSVPANILLSGLKVYEWRISYKGYNLGWSSWSEFTTFTTRQSQISQISMTIYPNQILPGKTTPLRWRWKNSSSTIFSNYIVPSESLVEVSANQEIVIDFEPYVGLIQPSQITVSLVAGETYVYTSIYNVLYGNIQCNISGSEYGQWRIKNTTTWRSSGYIESNLPYGIYTIEFETIAGYTTPSDISNVILISDILVVKTATYEIDDSQTYYMSVVINNAISGQQWRLNSSEVWNNSGDRISLFGISYDSIVFKPLENYIQPNNINFVIPTTYIENTSVQHPILDKTFYYEKEYVEDNIGYLTCNTIPSYAKWKISTSSTWNISNSTIDLIEGTYTINFETIGGYEIPNDETIIISPSMTSQINQFYILKPSVGHLKVTIDLTSGGWRVKNTTMWYNSDQIIDLGVGNYIVEFKSVENYITPTDTNISIIQDKLTSLTQSYVYSEPVDNSIQINVNLGLADINNNIMFRVQYSIDSISWGYWTDWIKYYLYDENGILTLNNKILGPKIGYYQIEFNTLAGYMPTQSIKIVEYKGVNTNITFDYNNSTTSIFKSLNLTVDLIDNKLKSISNSNLLNLLEFKCAIVSDSVYNSKNTQEIMWNNYWSPYTGFNNVLSKNNKYAFKIKPINNYFNIGETGNISFIEYNNNTSNFDLKLKYINYNITNFYFEIVFLNQPTSYQISDIEDFYINIRTKNEFEDVYGDSQAVLIYGNVITHTVDNINYKVLRSRKYTVQELFNSCQLGYISVESFNIIKSNFENIMLPYNINLVIYLDGYNEVSYMNYIS